MQGATVFFFHGFFADGELAPSRVRIKDGTIVEVRITTKDGLLEPISISAIVCQGPFQSAQMTYPFLKCEMTALLFNLVVIAVSILSPSLEIAQPMDPAGGSVADEIPRGIGIFVADFQTKFPLQVRRHVVLVVVSGILAVSTKGHHATHNQNLALVSAIDLRSRRHAGLQDHLAPADIQSARNGDQNQHPSHWMIFKNSPIRVRNFVLGFVVPGKLCVCSIGRGFRTWIRVGFPSSSRCGGNLPHAEY